MPFYVYILSDEQISKFIIGFTQNLVKNIHEMKNMQDGVYVKEKINKLIYFEKHDHYDQAKRREREMVSWDDFYTRQIIGLQNGRFDDLYSKIF